MKSYVIAAIKRRLIVSLVILFVVPAICIWAANNFNFVSASF